MQEQSALKARAIAFYLPQYHPIAENNEWWNPGFTEWTNVARARPYFRKHYQPRIPAELGFYDLRLPETRQAQADLARSYGIEGFRYYHYWFNGRRILERPFQEVLKSGHPDFPFCLCWANQTWSGIWHGLSNQVLIEQTYSGPDDHRRHFEALLPAFSDPRYIRVDGKPLFCIFRPTELPDPLRTIDLWQELAIKAGLLGLFVVGDIFDPAWNPHAFGFDASIIVRLPPKRRSWIPWKSPYKKISAKLKDLLKLPAVYPYERATKDMITPLIPGIESFPCVIPNWDNTPRSHWRGLVFDGSTPELFRVHLQDALLRVSEAEPEHRLLFVKSWNEWAEGNYLEPDLRFGHGYLKVLLDELSR